MVMPWTRLTVLALTGFAVLWAAEVRVRPQDGDAYPAKQKQGDVTVAVKAYRDDPQMESASGRTIPTNTDFCPCWW